MTSFSTVTPTPAPLDPSKHVNFTLGMVLGRDDFEQEFVYLSGRDKWLARDLIGAGTFRGLGVSIGVDAKGNAEVIVAPGAALTPQGQIVRVPAAQCAVLIDWVANHLADVAKAIPPGSPPGTPASGTLTLYVVLRYKEALTDLVPIPGEPCRSEDDATAPSRVADDFQLELCLAPPAPTEEAGMQAVLGWLALIPVVSGAGSTPGALVSALLAAFTPTSPPSSPAGVYPPPPPGLAIGTASLSTMYRTAMQLYATDLRDLLAGSATADAAPSETGVLLATLHVPVQQTLLGTWTVGTPASIQVDSTRPFLLPLDLLKEAWLGGAIGGGLAPGAPYRVVAAGMVAVKTAPGAPDPPGTDPPLISGLQALWAASPVGDVNVTFPDTPAPNTRYVVKVLPLANVSPLPAIGVVLKSVSPSPPGFTVHVSVNAADATQAVLTGLNLRLMIEVSAFIRP
jgi:hypothetical protein